MGSTHGGGGGAKKESGNISTLAGTELMNNLPYMGELTFDSRPRRGRKPKKADICHLISKNYGITFPIAYVNEPNSALFPPAEKNPYEKYFEEESARRRRPVEKFRTSINKFSTTKRRKREKIEEDEEPLNLCVKDTVLVTSPPSPFTPQKILRKKRGECSSSSAPPHSANPLASEVSICKFKFTGGARPLLQEKKMLSLDSGGNFRFYSDKPSSSSSSSSRPSLVYSNTTSNLTSSGASLDHSKLIKSKLNSFASSDSRNSAHHSFKTPIVSSSSICETSKNNLSAGTNGEISSEEESEEEEEEEEEDDGSSKTLNDLIVNNYRGGGGKKRKSSTKSLAREKLEKTFEEKGFLIQTQQLESKEGATYCKFRQLKKFTRYLFRSWKDYLPENVQGLSNGDEQSSLNYEDEEDPLLDIETNNEEDECGDV